MTRSVGRFTGILLGTVALAVALAPGAARSQAARDPKGPDDDASDIRLSYKLDPRLMGGTYGGERWVSTATYTGTNGQDSVDARAQVIDAKGKPTKIAPQWTASDPEMVTVSPGRGGQVKITVKRAGESKLKVAAPGFSKELVVRAKYLNKAIQVEISQQPAAPKSEQLKTQGLAAPAGHASALESRKEKLGYALGMNLARSLQRQSVEVDERRLIQGIEDAFSGGKSLMNEEEVRILLTEMRRELKANRRASRDEKEEELAEKNRKEGEAFLARNRTSDGVVTLKSGLQYKVLTPGEGRKPGPDDTVVCHYRASLIDGTEFDSSHARNRPATLPLNRAIQGWAQALQLMPVGSKWQLFVPSELAYGEKGLRGRKGMGQRVPPNSALVYELELLAIQTPGLASSEKQAVVTVEAK